MESFLFFTYKVIALTSWVKHTRRIHPAFSTGLVTSTRSVREHDHPLFTLPPLWNGAHSLFGSTECLSQSSTVFSYPNGNTWLFAKISQLGFMKHQKRNVIKTKERSSLLPGRVDKDAAPDSCIWLQGSDRVTRLMWGTKALVTEVGRHVISSTEFWDNSATLAL